MNEITKKTIKLMNNIESKGKCCIETSKDNKFVMRMEKDDKFRYIGSKYSVQRDVEKFYKDTVEEVNAETIFIVFGLGAGEHIRYLYDRITDSNKILIIEPSVSLIKEILKMNYLSDILQDDRIALCYFDDGIRKHLNDFIEECMMNNTKIKSFSNYNIIFEEEYKIILSELKNAKEIKKMGDNTFNAFSHIFFNNFIENIFDLDEFYTVNYLKDMYKDKPAVIVSAGPSLTKNIHLLKDVQDKFIIICGPRTIGTLIKNDITPDFICSVDPQDETYELMKDYINSKVPLVFMDSTSNKIVKKHKGLKIIAANQGMENYLEEILGVKVDSLMQGGSVAHFCMGLAVYIGCSNVIFIGQDLAYTNEKFQAEGTYAGEIDELKYRYEKNKEEWDKDKKYSLYVPDIYGKVVRTSTVLNSYRQEFEDLIYSCSGVEFINSSEGGANIKGTEVMDLKDSIRMYAKESINKNIEELLDDKIMLDQDTFIENMFKIIDKLEIIKKACEEGMQYSDKMLHFYKENKYCDMNKVFNKLDRIDSIINDKKKLGFIAYKVVSLINNVMQNDYYKAKENESEKELGIRLAKRSFGVYLAVLQTVEEAIFKINDKNLLKKNLCGKSEELKKINCDKNIDWKRISTKGIEWKVDKDREIGESYKCVEKYNLKNANIIVGDYNYDNGYLNIYTKKDSHNNDAGYDSTILFDKIDSSADTIFIDYEKSDDTCIYFNFVDNNTINFYESVKKNRKKIEEYDYSKYFSYGFFVDYKNVGSYINYYGIFFRDIIKKYDNYGHNNIVFDFSEKNFFINNERIPMSKYIMDKYLLHKNLLIFNTSNTNNSKLIIRKIEMYK